MEYLTSVVVFSISASVTPGPNSIMAMASAVSFGVRKSLPLLLGISIGFSIMLFIVGLGFGHVLYLFPRLTIYIKIIGIVYLLYLAFVIANSGEGNKNFKYDKPLSFSKGLLLQWVNAKAWIICISAVSTYTTAGNSYINQILLLTCIFLIVGPICVGIWVFLGAFLKKHVTRSKYIRRFNMIMAILLILSITPVIKDLWLHDIKQQLYSYVYQNTQMFRQIP
jgi:threonine/homoserine/homoserine lactone efflux protein